jgi:hypothetical protein
MQITRLARRFVTGQFGSGKYKLAFAFDPIARSSAGPLTTLCRPWPAAGSEQWNFNIQVMSTALGDASFNELIRVSGLTKQGRVWEKTDSARIDGQLKIRPRSMASLQSASAGS